MENKYEVIAEERLNNTTRLFTIVDFKTKNDYSCIIDEEEPNNVKILVDDLANSYDVGEALFKHPFRNTVANITYNPEIVSMATKKFKKYY